MNAVPAGRSGFILLVGISPSPNVLQSSAPRYQYRTKSELFSEKHYYIRSRKQKIAWPDRLVLPRNIETLVERRLEAVKKESALSEHWLCRISSG